MPEQFGHYLLEGLIGRGGMGEVYRAYDTKRDRIVALKRLPKELVDDETFQARFRRECRLVARLNEPHVIPIHDFGEINGHLYLDMRLVEGIDLSAMIADDRPMDAKVSVDIVGQIASALQSAHDSGLVHRDIKPSNILLTGITEDRQNAFAYLVDFGIARTEAGGGTALTATTGTVGTLGYMAPERISGADGDHRSDIYSLTCVLYESLTGHSPFRGETFQVMFAHVNAAPPVPSAERSDLPPGLDDVIRKGLAKDPDDRYQTAHQFAAAARAALAAAGVRPPPPPATGPPRTQSPPPRTAPPVLPSFTPRPPPFTPRPAPQGPPSGPQAPPPGLPGAKPPPSGPQGRPPIVSGPQGRPPIVSGPQHSGPIAPGAPNRPPSGPTGVPGVSGPSGPIPPAGGRRRAPTGNDDARRVKIAVTVVAVVVVLIVAIVIAVHGTGGKGQADPTTSNAASGWSNYSDFTALIGTSAGDTSSSFKNGTCKLKSPDPGVGMLDQVECTKLADSKVVVFVGRFRTKKAVDAYGNMLVNTDGYSKRYWEIAHGRRGLLFESPATDRAADVTSSICADPTFLVEFYATASTGLDTQTVFDQYWSSALFPNTTPAAC